MPDKERNSEALPLQPWYIGSTGLERLQLQYMYHRLESFSVPRAGHSPGASLPHQAGEPEQPPGQVKVRRHCRSRCSLFFW